MKTKYSVIPFIPAVIAAIGLKIMSMFAVDGNGLLFGMNKSGINYFIIEIILGLFAVCVLINLFDRKTAPVYPVKKNFVSGAFAVISGIAIVGSSFLALINATPELSFEHHCGSVLNSCGYCYDYDRQGAFFRQINRIKCIDVLCFPCTLGMQ